MNPSRLASLFPGIAAIALVIALQPVPVAAQLPPNVTWEQLTPQQQAMILSRLQRAQGGELTTMGQEGLLQLPDTLIPRPDTTRAITAVDTLEIAPPPPLDFALSADELDSTVTFELAGRGIFRQATAGFTPSTFGPVGDSYRLGPGDEVVLQLWGDVDDVLTLVLSREGYVFLPKVGQVMLATRTLEEARGYLVQRMTPFYQTLEYGRDSATTHLDLTLGKLRSVTVFVHGNALRPGAYTLTGTAMIFTALYAAGGPDELGDLRDIRLIRGTGIVARLDAYDYLMRGDPSADVRLEDNDIIFIPPAGTRVLLQGRIRRPGIYELCVEDGLKELISYGGGITPTARLDQVQIARIIPPAERGETPWRKAFIDVDLGRLLTEPDLDFPLYDGDVVTLLTIPADLRDYVSIAGAVWNPGRQQWEPDLALSEAIIRAGGLRDEALLSRVEIVRTNPDETTTQISRVLRDIMSGETDLTLERRDAVTIYSIHDLYPRRHVDIYGEVGTPGRYDLHENMTVMDLVTRAGGLTREAWTNWAIVVRMRLADDGSLAEFSSREVPLDTSYTPTLEQAFTLEDFDQVFVRRRPQWEASRNVFIGGEVLFPGLYSLRFAGEQIAEVIDRAGGLTANAYAEGARFFRRYEDSGRVNIQLARALQNRSSDHNLVMQPGDSLHVPPRVPFVTVRGQVGYPSSVMYVRGKHPRYYISQAGGFAEGADRRRVIVTLPNGSTWRPNWFFLPDPDVEPGSEIVVPIRAQPDRTTWEVIRDTAAVLSSLTTVLLLIWQINR